MPSLLMAVWSCTARAENILPTKCGPPTPDLNFGAVNTQGNLVMVGVGEHIGQCAQRVAFGRREPAASQ